MSVSREKQPSNRDGRLLDSEMGVSPLENRRRVVVEVPLKRLQIDFVTVWVVDVGTIHYFPLGIETQQLLP